MKCTGITIQQIHFDILSCCLYEQPKAADAKCTFGSLGRADLLSVVIVTPKR